MILLSICIPTFNRAKFLGDSLQSVVDAISLEDRQLFEIVISNNASTDRTLELVKEFEQTYPQLIWKVINQDSNIGPINVSVVSTYATGRFIWIISDDDLVVTQTFRRIVAILKNDTSLSGLIINYAPFKNSIRQAKKPVFKSKSQVFDKDNLLAFLGTQITFLSIIIFRRELSSRILSPEKLEGSISQSYLFLEVIWHDNIYYLEDNALFVRGHNSGGYNFYNVFIIEFEALLDFAKNLGFSRESIDICRKKNLVFLLRFTLSAKINNLNRNFEIDYKLASHLIIKNYSWTFISIFTIIILAIPDKVFGLFYGFIFRLKKIFPEMY